MLGIVRAIHHIDFFGDDAAADRFVHALQDRVNRVKDLGRYHTIIDVDFGKPNHTIARRKSDDVEISSNEHQTTTESEAVANETGKKPEGRIGNLLLIGLAAIIWMVYVFARKLNNERHICPEAKLAIAKQHLEQYMNGDAQLIGQREMGSDTELQFASKGSKLSVVVDKNGLVKEWKQTN
jgi:hypothetical protein